MVLIASLTPDKVIRYLDSRVTRGFNAIIVNGLEALFSPDPPNTRDGIPPFTTPGDLTTPNEPYFERLAWAIGEAGDRGLAVFLAPAYLGYVNANFPGYDRREEGWYGAVRRAGVEGARRYGEYVGRRLAHLDNIVWVLLGDRDPGDLLEPVRAMAEGLLSARSDRLAMAHGSPESVPATWYGDDAWYTVDATYTYGIVHRGLQRDAGTGRPFVLFETSYEGEWSTSELQIRRQAWWAIALGAAGQFMGQWPVWPFREGWEEALDSPGSRQVPYVRRFFESFDWWRTRGIPDGDFVGGNHFLREGLGELHGLDYAASAASAEGDLIAIYVPSAREILPHLARFGDGAWRARTFDPVTGQFVGDFDVTAGDRIPPATEHDWAIVLERA